MNENNRPRRVLFLCTENRARSQMAEAIMRRRAGKRFEAHSAGSRPASAIHPLAVEALHEIGIDAAGASPKSMLDLMDVEFELVVTLCGGARRDRAAHRPTARNDLTETWRLPRAAGSPRRSHRPRAYRFR